MAKSPISTSYVTSTDHHSLLSPRIPLQHRSHTLALITRNKFKTIVHASTQPNDATIYGQKINRRRHVETLLLALVTNGFVATPSHAIGFKKELKKRKISVEEYSELPNGLKFYDLSIGKGPEVKDGNPVTVHFDCIYKGIDVVSSRSARLLGGNRTIAEPFQFIAGQSVRAASAHAVGESAGGLFAGASGPKPPPALSLAVVGMRVGGKRSVIVPPELGYGEQGEQEIGPGQSFELQIELLDGSPL